MKPIISQQRILNKCIFIICFILLCTAKQLVAQSNYKYVINGPYKDLPGSYYIKLFVNFVQPTNNQWTTNMDLAKEADNTLTNLNAAFNKHNIYFLPYSYKSLCAVPDFVVHTWDFDIFSLRESLLQNSGLIEDAYHVYIKNPEQPTATGSEYEVPNNFCSVQGQRNGQLSSSTEAMIHEAGHNLGLVHTFVGSVGIDGCNETLVLDCDHCGDYVCDTPFNTDLGIVLNANCTHPTLPETIARNYMSITSTNANASCRNQFTEGQVKRMRTYLEQAPVLQAMQIHPVVFPLSMPDATSESIIVESGELVIDQDLSMLPGTSILVKKGASLVVKATITGACGQMWQGIIVDCDTWDPNQLPTLQGNVTINSGGKIEHARVGVDVREEYFQNLGGGILNANVAFFINNTIGVRFKPYYRKGVENGAIVVLPDKSLFRQSVFSIDDDYRGDPSVPPVHIEMLANFGIPISYSLFRDSRTACSNRAIGIDALNANFKVNNTHFENLEMGVVADKLLELSGGFRVESCKFQGCITGISANMVESSFCVCDNTFKLQSINSCDAINRQLIGMSISGATKGMTCTNNIFQNDIPSINASNVNTIGIHCSGIGTFFNQINHNQFHALHIGNRAFGVNGNATDGLVYLCNTHTNGALLLPRANYQFRGKVRKNQGNLLPSGDFGPTGNIFSLSIKRIENTVESVNYYFHKFDNKQNPTIQNESLGVNSMGVEAINTACLPTIDPCDPPCNEVALTEAKNAFWAQKALLQQKQIQLKSRDARVESPALEREMVIHQQKMNQESGKVLRYYAQDSKQLLVDSLLRWYYLIETMESWTTLAKHHFFNRDSVAFDAIWGTIPVHFNLAGGALASYNRINSFFSLMRKPILIANRYDKLPATTIAALNALITDCDEASFLAKAILRRNGVMAAVNCKVGPIEPGSGDTQLKGNLSNLILVPNPAQDQVTLIADPSTHAKELVIVDALGRIHISYPLSPNEVYIQVNTSTLPTGLYQVLLVGQVGVQSGRLMIQR